MANYLNNVPPYCAPFDCSDIYQFSTLMPQLSYIRLGDDIFNPQPDTINDGFRKINANLEAVDYVLRHFTGTYGKWRQNVAVTYSLSTFDHDALTARHVEVGDTLYFTTSTQDYPVGRWNYARAVSGATSEALGVVSYVTCDCFTLTINGYLSGAFTSSLLPGATYYLDPWNPGRFTLANPTTHNHVSKPLFTAISNDEVIVDIKRGVLVANYSDW